MPDEEPTTTPPVEDPDRKPHGPEPTPTPPPQPTGTPPAGT